jgi:hypothetical protein
MDKNIRSINKEIDHFFIEYEDNFNEAISGNESGFKTNVKDSFADCFIESGPAGVLCAKNDEQFIEKIEQGLQFYKSIGSRSMQVVAKDVTRIDGLHALVKATWHYTAIKKDKEEVEIDFDIFYLLRIENEKVKIITYIAGDEQKVLAEKGLVQEKQLH